MDQQKLTELLQQTVPEIGERTPFCRDDHEIAAYFDCKHPHPDRELSEHHLIKCHYCLARFAVLAQLHKSDAVDQVPESLLAEADQFGHQPQRRLRYTSVWATAAIIFIAVFAIAGRGPILDPGPGVQVPAASPFGENARQLRNINREQEALTILAPIKDANVTPEELTIRWTKIPGSLYYDIHLVNAEGFTIWQNRIEENQSSLPDDLELISGDPYFVRVDAYLAEAKRISSRHVQFTVNGND